jgi:hypothetical protein
MNLIKRLIGVISGEFLLKRRPNGGDVVFVRAVITTAIVFLVAIALRSTLMVSGVSLGAIRAETTNDIPWLGAIFGAAYFGFYARFSSQWAYLATLYNQLMASQVLAPFGAEDKDRARTYVAWWAGFIEDAEDVHLALKKNYAAVIVGLIQDSRIRQAYVDTTVGGSRGLRDLERKLEDSLGPGEFDSLKIVGAALARSRQGSAASPILEAPAPTEADVSAPDTVGVASLGVLGSTAHTNGTPLYPWKAEVNAQYQRIVDLLISLATAALVLPPLFLRDFFGIKDEPLAIFLDNRVWLSWGFLSLAIFFGIGFHYASTKWIKHVWGVPVNTSPRILEIILDFCFWGTSFSFIAGLGFFLAFIRS